MAIAAIALGTWLYGYFGRTNAAKAEGLLAQAETALAEAAASAEVVVLTASGTEENLLAAIRGGAAGYLLKTEPPERLVEFLHATVNGEAAPAAIHRARPISPTASAVFGLTPGPTPPNLLP